LAGAALVLLLATAPAAAGPRAPLDHAGRWITDATARVVVLHGWNMVYKVGSYRPEDAGFGADDARFLARHGFGTVRLGLIHRGIEPRPPGPGGEPRYREPYLRSIVRTQRVLAQERIFSLLDVHQDLYTERFQGEGMPPWAVVGDARTLPAQPRVGFPGNYVVMEALSRAFDHFWENDRTTHGRRLQRAFADMWQTVAARFRDRGYVLGYNLLNEPWPGSEWPSCANPAGCPAFDTERLTPFSTRVIEAIREVDRRSLVWYAPNLVFDFGADSSHGDTGDPHAGFAFNNYCLAELGGAFAGAFGGVAPPGQEGCKTTEEVVLDNADRQARQTGDALLMTEFAATDEKPAVRRLVEAADRHMISWQQWHYCACDDPTTTASPVAAQSLVADPAEPPSGENVDRDKLYLSTRPYPRAVSGTPLEYDFDYRERFFNFRYSTRRADGDGRFPPGSASEVFVPRLHYGDSADVQVHGARVTSAPGAQVLRLESCRGAKRIKLRVTPGDEVRSRCGTYPGARRH
jgi:endoglycosylceramidase